MRNLLNIFLALLVVAVGGYAFCAVLGWTPRLPVMWFAAGAAGAASAGAFVPLLLSRGASQPAVAQAGLLGTVIHLLGCLVGAAFLVFVLDAGTAGVYWVLAFYWATLAALVVGLTRAVRRAPLAPATK